MSKLPWYERRPVAGGTIAGVIVGVSMLLTTPFIDRTWPTKASAALSSPWARVLELAAALAGTFMWGHAVGRRLRPRPPGPGYSLNIRPPYGEPVVAGPKLNMEACPLTGWAVSGLV